MLDARRPRLYQIFEARLFAGDANDRPRPAPPPLDKKVADELVEEYESRRPPSLELFLNTWA